jgi:hypothetical protein
MEGWATQCDSCKSSFGAIEQASPHARANINVTRA